MPLKDLSAASDVINAIEGNLWAHYDVVCPLCRTAHYERQSHWMRLVSGIQYPLCNSILNPRLDAAEVDVQIEEAMMPFREQDLPMLWWLGPSAEPAELASHLTRHDLVEIHRAPGMAVELSAVPGIDTARVCDIRRTVTPRELDDWSGVFAEVFELPAEASAFFSEPYTVMAREQSHRFLQLIGYHDGVPVACGTAFIGAGAGGVYNIGTMPSARGMGIGQAVTTACLVWLKKAGMQVAILHSSEMGFGIYERMGFQQFCDFHLFTNATEERKENGV